jgi:tetratricopeptide (TPR) repeat protein
LSEPTDLTMEDSRVAEIKHLLSEKRFDEAFDRATALTRDVPGNVEGWWRLTLAAKGLKRWELAQNAVKETINLVPRWPIAWGEFGDILEALEQNDEARKAFERSIKIDPDYKYGHFSLMLICQKKEEYDSVIFHGQELERIGEPTAIVLDKIGLALWYKKNFHRSLDYYTKSATLDKQGFRYGNIGLICERPELAQYLDASDAYRRALLTDPGYERALQASHRLSEKLSTLARSAKQSDTQILDKAEFHRFYVNPFVLLGCDVNSDIESYPTKAIQKLKKVLVQEIDLEAGQIESLGRYTIDKSRALSLCDELLDDTTKQFHWIVFQDKRLCDFLHTGDIALFTYDEDYFPIGTFNALDDLSFLSWLSEAFSQQYDLVLSRALDQNNLAVIGALLSGRRYVTQQDEDLCFAGARRLVDRRMESIRNAEKEASTKRPSISALSKMLIDPNNKLALAPLLNLLPAAHFRSFQDEAVRLVRSIAVGCNNKHSDPGLAKEVLQLANAFAFVSADVRHQVETDEHKVNEIIAKDCEQEVRITQEGTPLVSAVRKFIGTSPGSIEITREGVRKDEAFIAAKDLKAIRWGISITRGLKNFFLSVQSDQGMKIQISWSSFKGIEHYNFSKMIDASVSYALPFILEKINADLDNDKKVVIGNCELTRSHLIFLSWFGTKRNEVPWPRVNTEMARGDVIISDRANSRVRIAMPMRMTYNAVTIPMIAALRGKQQ